MTSVDGNISLIGTGTGVDGLSIDDATVSSTGATADAATITLMGTTSGIDGVFLGGTSTVSTVAGNLMITGDATGGGSDALHFGTNSIVSSSGGGATAADITLIGTGGSLDAVFLQGDVTSVDGAITITGTTAAGADGVHVDSGMVQATGTGTIAITGDGLTNGMRNVADVTTNSGTITISSVDDDVLLEAGSNVTSTSGNVTVDADTTGGNGGRINMIDGSTIDAGSGVVDLDADGDILLSSVRTTTEVQATSATASILDNGNAAADITAATVALRALLGIGTDGDSLETVSDATTTTLTLAAVTDSGDIHVVNTGALIVGTVDTLVGVTIADAVAGGDDSGADHITLTAESPLTVNNDVTNIDGGDITLTATDSGAAGDDLTVATGVSVTAEGGTGSITLNAGDNIVLNGTSLITAASSGTVTVTADAGSVDAGGAITMADGSQVVSGSGTIDLDATDDVTLGRLMTSGNVTIDTTAGGVIDGGDTHVEVEADTLTINASGGIGEAAGSGADAALETTISTLNATTTGGSIQIDETDGATLAGVTAGGAGDVRIVSAAGDLDVQVVTASGNLVALTATAGAINDASAGEADNITAQDVSLQASTGIGDTSTDDADLDIAVMTLAATTSTGDISISDDGTLDVTTVDGLAGVSITTGGAGDDILIREGTTTDGDFDVSQNISNAGVGNVTLFAGGDSAGDEIDISANVTSAGGDVQIVSFADIDFNSSPTVSTNGSGTIELHAGRVFNFGAALTMGDAEGDIFDADSFSIETTEGNITLTATNDIDLDSVNADSDGAGAAGTVIVTADSDSDGAGSIDDSLTGEGANITGSAVVLRAATGIGSGAQTDPDIDTAVSTVSARNSTSGDIVIDNSVGGTLTIGTVDTLAGLTNSGGQVTVSNAGAITVDQNVSGTGDVSLAAEDSGSAGDNLAISTGISVSASAGNVTLNAGDNLTAAAGASVSASGNVTLTADAGSVDAGGAITLANTSTVSSTGGGNVDLTATDDVSLSALSTSGAVTVTSTAGSIVDNGDDATDISAATAVLSANGSIGQARGTDNGLLETMLDNVEAAATTGGVFLTNSTDLIVGGVSAATGISAGGDVDLDVTGSLTIDEDVTSGGSLTVDTTNDVTVNAAVMATSGMAISAGTDTSGSISVSGAGSLATTAAGADIVLTTGTTAGNVTLGGDVTSADDLTISTFAGGTVNQTAGTIIADLELLGAATTTLNSPTNDFGTIAVDLDPGSVSLTETNNVTVGVVGTATGIVTGGAGDGGDVTISAPNGRITVSNPIDTTTGTGGGISLSGAVTLNATLNTGAGTITLNGNDDGDDDLIVSANLTTGGALSLSASRDVIVDATVQTTGTGSDITITADNENDGLGGVQVTIGGQVNSADAVTLTGSDLSADATGTEAVQIDADGTTAQVLAGGNITVQPGTNAPANSDLEINGLLQSTGAASTIAISANQDVLFGANGDVTRSDAAVSGLVSVFADRATAGSTGGVITMANGTVINGGGGQVELFADGRLTLGQVITTDLVNVVSLAADIEDGGNTGGEDVIADRVAFFGETGVGTDADSIETLSVAVAGQTDSGDFHLAGTGNVIVGTVLLTSNVTAALPGTPTSLSGILIDDTAGGTPSGNNLTVSATGAVTINRSLGNDSAGTVRVLANSNIFVNSGVTSNGGAIVLNSDRDQTTTTGGGIVVTANVTSNGGNITLGGGTDPSTTAAIGTATTLDGVRVDGATLNAGAGDISVRGTSSRDDGVQFENGGVARTTTGNIELTGISTATNNANGVELEGATTLVTSDQGDITLTGTSSTGDGVDITDATVSSTGGVVASAGGILINGTTVGSDGVFLSGSATVTSVSGMITIEGDATAGGEDGVHVGSAASVTSTGGAPNATGITIDGTGGTLDAVFLEGSITTVDAAIAISGQTTTGVDGVHIETGMIQATGTGTIQITGDGVTSGVRNVADVISNSGSITISSVDDDVLLSADSNVTSTTGAVSITADMTGGSSGALTMTDTAVVNAGSGQISISADGNVTLGRVVTTNNTGSAIAVASTTGQVIDGGDTGGSDLVATGANAVVTITAANGIGATGGLAADNAIETTVANLDASAGAGNLDIDEANGITLVDVDTTNGSIRVDAGGQIVATDVASGGGSGDNVTLNTTAGGIVATLVSSASRVSLDADTGDVLVGVITAASTATVNADTGSINDAVDDSGSPVVDITAPTIDLNAAAGIGNTAPLELSGTSLSADNSGAGAVDIDNISASPVTVTSISTVGSPVIFDQSGGGSVTFTGPITSGTGGTNGGNITLNATSDLTIAASSAISSADGIGGTLNISGAIVQGLPTVGAGNILITGGSLDTIVVNDVSTAASVTLSALRDVLIGGVVMATGATSDITINADTDLDGVGGLQVGPDGGLNAGRDVTATGSDVFATAGVSDSIDLQPGTAVAQKVVAGNDISLTSRTQAPATADIVIGGEAVAGGMVTIDAADTTTLFSSVSAGGDVNLLDPVILSGDATISGVNVTVQGTLNDDGDSMTASNLVVNASGTTRFNGAVGNTAPIDSLTTDAAGTTLLNGGITVEGDVTLNDAVTLTGDATITATNVTFGSTVDDDGVPGTGSNLVVNADGATLFLGPIGGTNALESVTTDAAGTTQFASVVNVTTGTITFNDPVLLTENIQVNAGAGGSVAFNSTINSEAGEHNTLTISGGAVTFDGDIGNGTNGDQAIGSLDVTTATSVTFGTAANPGEISSVRTDGPINLGSAAPIAGGVTFDSAAISIETTGDAIRVDGPITLAGSSTTLSTGATTGGDITFTNNASIDSASGEMNNLTLTAGTGSVFFNEDLGGTVAVGALDVTRADGGVVFGQADTEMPDGTGPVDLINAFGGINIGSATPIAGGIVLDPSGATLMVVSSGGQIRFNGEVDIRATEVAIDSGAATGGDIVFENGLTPQGNNVTNLNLTTGGGDVLVRGDLGTTANRFDDVVITLADDVTIDGIFEATSFTQNGGTGTTTIGGTVNTTGAAGINITTSSLTLNGDLMAGGGGPVIVNAGATINANVNTQNAPILFGQTTTGPTFTMANGTEFNVNGTADIRVRATGDISISRLVNDSSAGAGTVITVESLAGGIIDSGDTGGADIVSETVRLQAAVGIGGDGSATDAALSENPADLPTGGSTVDAKIESSAIDTETRMVSASNSAGGDIRIHNSVGGLLTIGTVDGLSGVTNADAAVGGGTIQITNESPITIGAIGTPGVAASDAEGVFNTAGGSITITAIDSAGAGDDLTLNAPVRASGGNGSIVLNAGDDLIANSHIQTDASPSGGLTRAGNVDLNAGATLTLNNGPEMFDVQTGSPETSVDVEDTEFDSNSSRLSNRQIRYSVGSGDEADFVLADGAQFATFSGIVNGLPGLYEIPVEFPQVGSDGNTTATVTFGRSGETNFRILVSWGDDSFSFDHFSAEDASSGGTDVLNDMIITEMGGEFVLEFEHFYDARNLPDPDNPGDPIPIRVFAQSDPNVLFVRSDDSLIAPTIDAALATISQDILDLVGADKTDTSAAGAKAASPYLSTSETILPSDLFAELESGGRIDTLRSAVMPNETQASQFSNEVFNTENVIVLGPGEVPGPGERAILDATLEEVFETILPAQAVRTASDPSTTADLVETFNFSATGALAPVPGTVPSSDPIVFELDTFVPPAEREESLRLGESFNFTANVVDQTASVFVAVARGEETAAEERIVWLVVLNPVQPGKALGSGGIRTEVQLTEEVLDDLPGRVYKRLPDGDYQIFLQEAGESKESRKLVIEVRIRDGKPADVDEKTKVFRKPKADEEAPNENGIQKPDEANEGAARNEAEAGGENAQAPPAPAGREVSQTQPESSQDEAWATWRTRETSAMSEDGKAEEEQAEQRTTGMSSLVALAAGGTLVALNRDGNWRKEIDESMAQWEKRRKRRPR